MESLEYTIFGLSTNQILELKRLAIREEETLKLDILGLVNELSQLREIVYKITCEINFINLIDPDNTASLKKFVENVIKICRG